MKNKQTLILIIVLIFLIIASAGFVGYTIFIKLKNNQEVSNIDNNGENDNGKTDVRNSDQVQKIEDPLHDLSKNDGDPSDHRRAVLRQKYRRQN